MKLSLERSRGGYEGAKTEGATDWDKLKEVKFSGDVKKASAEVRGLNDLINSLEQENNDNSVESHSPKQEENNNSETRRSLEEGSTGYEGVKTSGVIKKMMTQQPKASEVKEADRALAQEDSEKAKQILAQMEAIGSFGKGAQEKKLETAEKPKSISDDGGVSLVDISETF